MKGVLLIRELAKAVLIMFYWAFPIRMWEFSGNSSYLWLFVLSFLLTCATIAHYENLAEWENSPKDKKVTVEDLYPSHDEEQRS